MTIKLTWFGHACFLIETAGSRLLTDPFLDENPLSPVKAQEVDCDFIFVSHGHGDHLGDTVAISRRTGATVVANYEICNYLQAQGLSTVHPMHIGGGYEFPWGRIKLTIAHHGSALPDGSYGGNPAGLLFYIEDKKIYHACDTGLFLDMKLIGEESIDLAILPIGDNFTMGPVDALRAVKLIKPRRVMPVHYDTFDIIRQDPDKWAKNVAAISTSQQVVLKPGQSLEL